MVKDADPAPGLYVHIPFCLSRCSYCTFSSGLYDPNLVDRYLDALAVELSCRKEFNSRGKPATLFIGGGTPSLLSLSQLEKLFSLLPFPDVYGEATCEINPDSFDVEKLALFRQYGINRCSFGVQTFSERGLALLGRRHSAEMALDRISAAMDSGIQSVSLDLISGWPGQTEEELITDLSQACELGITHISCYNLMIEEKARLRKLMERERLSEKSEDEMRLFWDITDSFLEEEGYVHYETSNFARPGFSCRHNINTWKGKNYLGIGAAAHSHIRGRRFANHADATSYVSLIEQKGMAEVFSETLDPISKAKECVVFWLRLFEGIDCADFQNRIGIDVFELYSWGLTKLISDGYLKIERRRDERVFLKINRRFQPILDSILVDLV